MNKKTATFVVLALIIAGLAIHWLLFRSPGSESVLTVEDLCAMVPEATAIRRDEVDTLFSSPNPPRLDTLKNQPLSLIHLSLVSGTTPLRSDARSQSEFRVARDRPPRPHEIAVELYRRTGPHKALFVTTVHGDRITACTCEVSGDTATGMVSFDVPNLYAGSFDYVARRDAGRWTLREFSLPTYDLKTVLGDDGVWRVKTRP